MTKDYRCNGIELYWGDNPVGDFDLRHFDPHAKALLLGEWKWVDKEIERDIKQRCVYEGIIDFFHPRIWIVYIIGTVVPDGEGRFWTQCERFLRLMPGRKLDEICIPNLQMKPGNVSFLISHFKAKASREIFDWNVKRASNDNVVRFVPNYGRKKA
jgi:hypothetical protein